MAWLFLCTVSSILVLVVSTSSSLHLWILTLAGDRAAAMVAADIDEGAGEGWGEDAALVIDEGTRKSHFRNGFLLIIPIHFALFYNK